ncbi:MAG: hypothetical protein WA137_04540 [Methanothrix sp.]|jgi:hypothetical protein
MTYKKFLPYIALFTLSLLISLAGGQDYLGGGYVGPYGGDIAQYFTDPIFSPNQQQSWETMYYPYFGSEFFMDYAYPYQFRNGTYPGPYGVYPFYQSPLYSDFRLNSLAGMDWEPFQKNWAETMDYAQTKSSFRVYQGSSYTNPPIQSLAPTYITTQSPTATTDDSTATIVSKGMRGYQVFLDGNYIGTDGTGGDPLDGKFSFRVAGNQNHDIRVYDGQFNYPKTMFFERGGTKIINVEPGTAVYI